MKIVLLMLMMTIAQSSQAGKIEQAKLYITNLLSWESPVKDDITISTKTAGEKAIRPWAGKPRELVVEGQYGLKRSVREGFWERNSEGNVEHYREVRLSTSASATPKDDLVVHVKMPGEYGWKPERIQLTKVSSSTISASSFDGIAKRDGGFEQYPPQAKPKEEDGEVEEARIKNGVEASTSNATAKTHEKTAVSSNVLPPKTEVADIKDSVLPPSATEAEWDQALRHKVETSGSAEQERGVWVKNHYQKNLQVIIQVRQNGGIEEVDMGILGEGDEMFLPCPLDQIFLTVKSGWFKKDIYRAFKRGEVGQVNLILKKSGEVEETKRQNS